MKKIILFSIVSLLAFAACKKEAAKTNEPQQPVATESKKIDLGVVENYFATVKVESPTFLVLKSQEEFDQNFNPAKTMTNTLTTIEFSKSLVGAIVFPASEYETKINIDSAYIQGKILHVVYNIEKDNNKRTFSSVPQSVFTIDSSIATADSISFDSSKASVVLPL